MMGGWIEKEEEKNDDKLMVENEGSGLFNPETNTLLDNNPRVHIWLPRHSVEKAHLTARRCVQEVEVRKYIKENVDKIRSVKGQKDLEQQVPMQNLWWTIG